MRDNPYLNERWYQIQSLLQKASDDGLKYLTLINGGGAVAILSFIASDASNNSHCMWISFVVFFVGLILVGIVNLKRYLLLENMLESWGEDSNKFRKCEIEYDELIANDNKAAKRGDKIFHLAIACFVLPILGFTIGIMKIAEICVCS